MAWLSNLNDLNTRTLLEKQIDPKTGKNQLQLQLEHQKNVGKREIQNLDKNVSELPEKGRQKGKSLYSNKGFRDSEGVYWQSQWEYTCWLQLKDLERLKIISQLERQKTIIFTHCGVKIWEARLDFIFLRNSDLKLIYADSKCDYSTENRIWKTTCRMVLAFKRSEILIFYQDQTNIEQAIKNFGLQKD